MNNAYEQFRALVPEPPLEVGTVVAVGPGGATIELPGGGALTVRGSASVGEQVFIRAGVIESTAPVLPTVDIEL
ncbi:hypothetical protein [Tibeticola sp.]|uniref:hypothetical protein n=1 Tax=Tibeticola sp. TaxID=2005368 RepID=UPI0025EEE1DB|nr:hypothetical protein [Tibeticola sp.]